MTGWKLVPEWAISYAAPAPPEDVLEKMARAFLEEYDTYRPGRGEAYRQREAMRAALAAAEDRGEQASIPSTAVGENRT